MAAELRAKEEIFERILRKYWLKVGAERDARLEGRIVEADFYVRQLTYFEIILEIGGYAQELLSGLKLGGRNSLEIVATPMSLLLDRGRRLMWGEKGEPERPPLPPLGDHDERTAGGERNYYLSDRDGDYQQWADRRAERIAIAGEAQQAWEEKARAEAEAWAKREAERRARASDASAAVRFECRALCS